MSSHSSIITQTYLDTSDRAILLRGNEYVKPMTLDERWTKIRFGMLISMTPDSTNNLLQGLLVAGLCSGISANFASPNARFLGTSWGNYATMGTNWTFNSSPPNSYLSTATENVFSKIGTAYTPTTANYTARFPLLDANPRRGVVIVDILKGSPNYSITSYTGVVAHMSASYGMNSLYNAMEQVNATPIIGGTQFTTAGAVGVAFSETPDNKLTALNLYWNRWSFPVQLSGLATYIVY